MNTLEAKTRMKELAAKADSIVKDTVMTANEKKSYLDKLEVDLKEASDVIAVADQAARFAYNGEVEEKAAAEAPRRFKSLGEELTSSSEYQSILGADRKQFSRNVDIKTAANITEGTPTGSVFGGSGGGFLTPDYLPGIVDKKFAPLLVADLFAQGTTDAPQISYVEETAFNNNAAGTSEGSAYSLSDDVVTRKFVQLGKLAHYAKTTDEMLQDVPAFASWLNARLALGLQQKEQTELLYGSGVPSIDGLLGHSGLATSIEANGVGEAIDIEAIFAQVNVIRNTAFLEPDAVLVNPTDWQRMRLRKDVNGQYLAGGPFTGAYGTGGYTNVDALWGVRVVVTPAIAAGTALVGAFHDGAQLFRKSGISVQMTNSNEDDFKKGLVTVRAEQRVQLATYRPGAFGKVTFA